MNPDSTGVGDNAGGLNVIIGKGLGRPCASRITDTEKDGIGCP